MSGALIAYLLGRWSKRGRDYFSMLVTLAEFILALMIMTGLGRGGQISFSLENFLGFGLALQIDGFRGAYCVITSFMWLLTMIFSREYFHHYRNRNRYHFFTLLTLAFTVGVFLAADLFTTFVFFEMMSLTSFAMVIHDEKPFAVEAAKLYLYIAMACGLVLLLGIQMLASIAGTLRFDELFAFCSSMEDKSPLLLPGVLMLVGFGAKAGMFPLHIWLPEAHPAAPAPASALLSGVLTKSGVLGILAISTNLFYHDGNWGFYILILGTITMVLGAVLALFAMDLKRILACSSVSQIGFILVGTGMQGLLGEHNALAVRGTFLHMVNHSLIKLALFLAAGVVYINTHELSLEKIRGFGRGKTVLHFAFLAGALSIMGIPLASGYISKTLLHESIVEYIHLLEELGQPVLFYQTVELLFKLTGGITVAYILKIYFALFWEKKDLRQDEFNALNADYLRKKGKFVLCAAAVVLLILGFLPYQTMDKAADLGQGFMRGNRLEHAVHYFEWANLKGALYSISIGILVYGFFVRKVLRDLSLWPGWLDLNHRVYRPLFTRVLPAICSFFAGILYLAAEKRFDAVLITLRAICSFFAGALYLVAEKGFDRVLVQGNMLIQGFFSFVDRTSETYHHAKERRIERYEEFTFGSISKERKVEDGIWRGISNSLSYSLLLFGVGLLISMFFLLARW